MTTKTETLIRSIALVFTIVLGHVLLRFQKLTAAFLLFIVSIALLNAESACAQQAFFTGLGDLPGGSTWSWARDVSADGSIVVGQSSSAAYATEAFRWTRSTGMVCLGAIGVRSSAARISGDGTTIVGQTDNNSGTDSGNDQPYRWTESEGMQIVSGTPLPAGPTGINADGSVVVYNSGWWWTQSGGVQPPIPPITRLSDVSDDGTVFTGWDRDAGGYAWSEQDGLIDLGLSPDGFLFSSPHFISADGKVIVGDALGQPVRWTKETGAVDLGPLPGAATPRTVGGVSADGSVIVGRAIGGSDSGAYIWDPVHGSRNLKQVLTNEYGLAASVAGWEMKQAFAVSSDGRTIVGGAGQFAGVRTTVNGVSVLFDVNPQGQQEAWIAFLGTPVTPTLSGDYNRNGNVDAGDYVVWRNLSGQTGTGLAADGNGDGVVDGGDYDVWRSHFGQTAAASWSSELGVPEPPANLLAALAAVVAILPRTICSSRPITSRDTKVDSVHNPSASNKKRN